MAKEIDTEITKTSFRSSQLQGADLPLFVKMWLSDLELHLAASSHRTYQQAMEQFLSYWNKRKKPPFDPLLIKQYVRELKWRRSSAAYAQRQLSVLRSFCAWAVDQNILPSNPARKIPLPKLSTEYRKEALSQEEAGALIKTLSYHDFYIWTQPSMQQRSVAFMTRETGLRLYIRPFLDNDLSGP